jgi:hypothetical protein
MMNEELKMIKNECGAMNALVVSRQHSVVSRKKHSMVATGY